MYTKELQYEPYIESSEVRQLMEAVAIAAHVGGKETLRYHRMPSGELHTEAKKDRTIVGIADRMSERVMQQTIQRRLGSVYADLGLNAEESGYMPGDLQLLLDGVDGSFGFTRGGDEYAVIAGILEHPSDIEDTQITVDNMLTAAICLPKKQQLIYAARGQGAHCLHLNDDLSQVIHSEQLLINENFVADWINMIVSMDANHTPLNIDRKHALQKAIMQRFGTVSFREYGSNGHDQCMAVLNSSEGRNMIDLYFADCFSGPWDILPGAFIIQEAGGIVIDPTGNKVNLHSKAALGGSEALVYLFADDFRGIYSDYTGFAT